MQTSKFSTKISKILTKVPGIKVALFDSRSCKIISTCTTHTIFLQNDCFLLSMIEDNLRTKMANITCAAFISEEGLPYLIKELQEPVYGSYSIFFLNEITETCLAELAKNDKNKVVNECYEIYVDLHNQDINLLTVSDTMESVTDIKSIRSIVSLLNTLEIHPYIHGPNQLKGFCKELNNSVEKFNKKRSGNLVVFDRSMDLVTPLLYNWHYQSMLYEHTDYLLGLVKLGKVTYQLFDDPLFNDVKFNELSTLKNQILNSPHKHNSPTSNNNLNTVLKEKDTNLIETHLTLHNYITTLAIKNGYLSDLEYSLVADSFFFKNNLERLILVLKNKEIDVLLRLKLFIITIVTILNPIPKKEHLITHWFVKQFPEFLTHLFKFFDTFKPNFSLKPTFKKDKDYKLGFIPPVIKYMKQFFTVQLKDFYYEREPKKSEMLIIYFKGGVTMAEYMSLQLAYPDSIIVADYLCGYKDILKEK